MTLEQLAGQLLWCGWGDAPEPDAAAVNAHTRVLVEELQVGGLVLFTRNLGTPAEIAALVSELRCRSPLPPLIGIDQEGGRVSRLALPGTTFPGNMALGTLDDPPTTRLVHQAIGEQLAALGIDVDFAPVLDVNNNPANPIIGVRSFGEDPDVVARHGVAAVRGFGDAGVLPVVKHFPGHGDTSADSHLELPVQPAGRERLERVELVPFRAAIAAGAPAVMTTHIMFPELDPELPSTLSPRILGGLLRRELGFDGLVVTDCVEMRGIADHWSPEDTAVLALEAGADMLLVCHTLETQRRMHAAICDAVRAGRLSMERLRQSFERVERARRWTRRVRESAPDPALAGSTPYRELEGQVARRSLAILDGERLLPDPPAPTGWTTSEPLVVSGARDLADHFTEVLRTRGVPASTVEADPDALRAAPQLVWMVLPNEPFAGGNPTETTCRLLVEHQRAVVVAAREPYCLAYYPKPVPRLAAWGTRELNLQAVARWLLPGEGDDGAR